MTSIKWGANTGIYRSNDMPVNNSKAKIQTQTKVPVQGPYEPYNMQEKP